MLGFRAFGQRQKVVRLVAVVLRLDVLVAVVLGDNHVGALAVNHRVEGMLALLDVVDGLGLSNPPARGRPRIEAAYELDALVRVVPVCLIDAVDLQIHLSYPFERSLYCSHIVLADGASNLVKARRIFSRDV